MEGRNEDNDDRERRISRVDKRLTNDENNPRKIDFLCVVVASVIGSILLFLGCGLSRKCNQYLSSPLMRSICLDITKIVFFVTNMRKYTIFWNSQR